MQGTVFFRAGAPAVSLWFRRKLAADLGVTDHASGGFGGVALARNLRSPDEVDQILAAADEAGVAIARADDDTMTVPDFSTD